MSREQAIRGDRVRMLRERLAMNQKELAAAASVSQSYVSAIESGSRQSVGSIVMLGLAHALSTSADYLMGLTDNPEPGEVERDIPEDVLAILPELSSLPRHERQTVVNLILDLARRSRRE